MPLTTWTAGARRHGIPLEPGQAVYLKAADLLAVAPFLAPMNDVGMSGAPRCAACGRGPGRPAHKLIHRTACDADIVSMAADEGFVRLALDPDGRAASMAGSSGGRKALGGGRRPDLQAVASTLSWERGGPGPLLPEDLVARGPRPRRQESKRRRMR